MPFSVLTPALLRVQLVGDGFERQVEVAGRVLAVGGEAQVQGWYCWGWCCGYELPAVKHKNMSWGPGFAPL